ncbi:MAG TPA: 30S ribosomal protein S4 [Armatimonadota bacterium]|nr:30S ribosomal protein S4 [Armatimonadota bacterium]
MGRYTGPVCKLCRREGMKLLLKGAKCFGAKCPVDSRPFPPGQHGQGRKKVSDYGHQLREKQKVRRYYGVFERQFRNYFGKAVRQRGVTGETMLQQLELRLDNLIFRSGLVSSRAEARQLITHRHFTVNGRIVTIPSYQVKPGDVVEVRERSKKMDIFQGSSVRRAPSWMSVTPEAQRIDVLSVPTRDAMELPEMHEQLIVEFFSR